MATLLEKALHIIRGARECKDNDGDPHWVRDERVCAEQILLLMSTSPRFAVGDHVHKPKGYRFPGVVRAVLLTGAGQRRLVVEMDNYGLLHIFNEDQLVNDTREDATVKEPPKPFVSRDY